MHWGVKLEGGPRRVNHAAVAVRDKIYSFGGYCTNEHTSQSRPIDVHVLNTNNYRWSIVPLIDDVDYRTVPFQRYGHSAVVHGDNVYIWGGRNDHNACNKLYCFDPLTYRWSAPQVYGNRPGARDGHSACYYDGKMYIFGGFDEEMEHFSQSVYILDFATMKWRQLPTTDDSPTHRDFHTAVVYDHKMYIFGGRGDRSGAYHTQDEIYFKDITYLDLKTHKWHKPKCSGSEPIGRRSHSAFVYNKGLYIFGGYNALVNEYYNHLYRLCLETYEWVEVNVFGIPPCVRRRQACVVVGDRMFLFGGTTPKCPATYVSMEDPLLDHNDLHVLEFQPSLMMLCLLTVIKFKICPKALPEILRCELRSMTTPNSISRQLSSTG